MIFIGAAFSVRGLDQALLRNQVDFSRLKGPLALQSLTLALAPGLISTLILSVPQAIMVYASAASLSFFLGAGGYLRSDFQISRSILVIHGWKAVLLVSLGAAWLLGMRPSPILFAALALVGCLPVIVRICDRVERVSRSSTFEFADTRDAANRFWITSIIASGFVFIDQIVLNLDNAVSASAIVFSYSSLLLPIPLFVAGFSGNILNPWLRQKGEDFRPLAPRLTAASLLLGVAIVTVSQVAGFVAGGVLGRFDDFDGSIFFGIAALALLRFLYVGPSAAVGVFGSLDELRTTAIAGGLSVAMVPVMYFLTTRLFNWNPADAILIAFTTAAFLRIGVAASIVRRILKDPQRLLTVDAHGNQ